MVSRNQRKEKDENITRNMDNEDKCLTADVNKEASDEDGVRGDEETSLIVWTLEGIKLWMRQMEQEQKKAREEIVRVSQTNLSNLRRQSLRGQKTNWV